MELQDLMQMQFLTCVLILAYALMVKSKGLFIIVLSLFFLNILAIEFISASKAIIIGLIGFYLALAFLHPCIKWKNLQEQS